MDKLSSGRVLLVGEGDFSFTVAFVKQISPQVELVSSSLLSEEEFTKLHSRGPENVQNLRDKGVEVLFSVDATELERCDKLSAKFDRVIFNFPHVGGKSDIKRNRKLVRDFFISVVNVLAEDGDVCVSFCRGQGGTSADRPIRAWYNSWQSVTAAADQDLVLREVWPFDEATYPEYSSTGFRSTDQNFFTGDSLTYVFRRCIPLPRPIADFELTAGTVFIHGNPHQIHSQYIADKFNRRLDVILEHPVSRTKHRVLRTLQTAQPPWPVEELADCDPRIPTPYDSRCLVRLDDGQTSLRRSLLDHLPLRGINSDHLTVVSGNVARVLSAIDAQDLPVQHEVLMALRTSATTQVAARLKQSMVEVMESVIGRNCKLSSQSSSSPLEWFPDDVVVLETLVVEYDSLSVNTEVSCNQLGATGPPQVPEYSPPRARRRRRHVGWLWSRSDGWVGVLWSADALTVSRYDMPDARSLWSRDPTFLNRFSDDNPEFLPLSLYSPLWRHDISMWQDCPVFPEREFASVIREVTGDALAQLLLQNVWAEPVAGRLTPCYRLVYQSHDSAVSHGLAHQIQDVVRLMVDKHVAGLTVR